MRRSISNSVVAMLLVALAATWLFTLPAGAQDEAADPDPAPTVVTVGGAGETVTDLPATGRGHGVTPKGADSVALDQLATTMVVLLSAAALALGGLAVLARYERR